MATTSGRTSTVSVPLELQLKLDPETESLSLLSILRAFDGPVNEERAWAVLHQAAKTALQCFTQPTASTTAESRCCAVTEASQLLIHRDGHVHPRSFIVPSHQMHQGEGRSVVECQSQLVAGLGWALFEALDYGNKREEQNVLSPDLELLIDLMTANDNGGGESHSAEDEGIERDSGDAEYADQHPSIEETAETSACSAAGPTSGEVVTASGAAITSLAHVMDRCRMQISSAATAGQADAHFRAVCRALVAETLEFSDFLIKVSSAPENWQELRSKPELHSSELTGLHLADWAKLWVQVIRQLRIGVKLKATHLLEEEGGLGGLSPASRRKPIEYELTPYEMMMDDIRSRRYKLRQVMVDGAIPPRVKKDAHAVILEFIRSRPPLRKASERKLGPPARRVSTPVELLMESIRQHPGTRRLRPTRSLMVVKNEGLTSSTTTIKRRLVKADFDTLLNFNQEDEDDFEDISAGSPPSERRSSIHEAPDFRANGETLSLSSTTTTTTTPLNHRNGSNGRMLHREASPASRRHSMMAALPLSRTVSAGPALTGTFPVKSQSHNSHLSSYLNGNAQDLQRQDPRIRLHPGHLSGGSLPCSGPSSSSSSSSIPGSPGSPSHQHLQEDFLRSEHFRQEVQGKLVTLEELVHMRRVLTAASVENLPLDSTIKDDVINGKVCFVCRKTRLSIFSNWWRSCKLCRRTVCTKCCTKMRIPSDRFDSVAVSELSWPSSSSSLLDRKNATNEQPEPSPSGPSSLFAKLPQFRLYSPGGTISSAKNNSSSSTGGQVSSNSSSGGGSTPSSSPVFPRNNNITNSAEPSRKQTLAGAGQKFLHQALSRHQSHSANSTPVRNPLTGQSSLNVGGLASSETVVRRKSSSGSDCSVCLDCQSLIEHIVYHPVHTLHQPRDFGGQQHHHHQQQHISLP